MLSRAWFALQEEQTPHQHVAVAGQLTAREAEAISGTKNGGRPFHIAVAVLA